MNGYEILIDRNGNFISMLDQKCLRCDTVHFIIFQDCQRCDLVFAALTAKGKSKIRNISQIDRDHYNVVGKLRSPGAYIEPVWNKK